MLMSDINDAILEQMALIDASMQIKDAYNRAIKEKLIAYRVINVGATAKVLLVFRDPVSKMLFKGVAEKSRSYPSILNQDVVGDWAAFYAAWEIDGLWPSENQAIRVLRLLPRHLYLELKYIVLANHLDFRQKRRKGFFIKMIGFYPLHCDFDD
jgi:hypothetical protein